MTDRIRIRKMNYRLLAISLFVCATCCPALCAFVHAQECLATTSESHSPDGHDHRHDCFCSGESAPLTGGVSWSHVVVQPGVSAESLWSGNTPTPAAAGADEPDDRASAPPPRRILPLLI